MIKLPTRPLRCLSMLKHFEALDTRLLTNGIPNHRKILISLVYTSTASMLGPLSDVKNSFCLNFFASQLHMDS